jgi:hypothetical protein
LVVNASRVKTEEVLGRMNFYNSDLHAADVIYHHDCNTNFRMGKSMPLGRASDLEQTFKRRRSGRPVDDVIKSAFDTAFSYLEVGDRQVTVGQLRDEMREILQDNSIKAEPYSKNYIRIKLKERFGDGLHFARASGQDDIIVLYETVNSILRQYHSNCSAKTEEDQKRKLIRTAAKLIQYDVKRITCDRNSYPAVTEMTVENALDFVPETLRIFLTGLFPSIKCDTAVAMIGQIIMQNTRPRSLMAPLYLGLAVQLHFLYRSRFLIDHLNSLGLIASYDEVMRFGENAATCGVNQSIGSISDDHSLLFAADNVDSNIVTLDGYGTFHGLG